MREIFTSGSVGRAPGNRCLYPEVGQRTRCPIVCSSLRSLYRTQLATACTAADAGVS